MREYDLYLFDFDNTLYDTSAGIHRILEEVLPVIGVEYRREEFTRYLGMSMDDIFDTYSKRPDAYDEYRSRFYDAVATNSYRESEPFPETPRVLRVLKEKNGVASFIPELSNDESYWGPMLFAAFGKATNMNFDDDGTGKVVFNRTSEQMKRYLSWMNELYEEGLIHQEYLTLDGTSRYDAARSGKVAFIGGGEGNNIAASDFADGRFHLSCLAPLTSEYDDDQTILGKSGYFTNGSIFINADSPYVDALCRMFDIIYATEEVVPGSGLLGESFTYGIKGVDSQRPGELRWRVHDLPV